MISVDGVKKDYFEGISGKQYSITCKAFRAKPAVPMKWTLNGLQVDSELLSTENGSSNTFDLSISINYTGNGSVDVFKCSIERENYFSAKAALLIKTYGKL